jgi:hypothetical protein
MEGWGRKSPARGRERRELLVPGREGRSRQHRGGRYLGWAARVVG